MVAKASSVTTSGIAVTYIAIIIDLDHNSRIPYSIVVSSTIPKKPKLALSFPAQEPTSPTQASFDLSLISLP